MLLDCDVGSSNTWVGADKKYVKTSTSKSTGATVVRELHTQHTETVLTRSCRTSATALARSLAPSVSMTRRMLSDITHTRNGLSDTDTVTLGPSLVIQNQSIGVASTAQGFQGVDGILGVGPTDLTSGTLSTGQLVPTVTDNLFSQGTIASDSLGIFYQPTTEEGDVNGELNFGGIDESKYVQSDRILLLLFTHRNLSYRITGDVSYVPITSTSPASNYWGIDQDLSYGDGTTLLTGSAGIVDTGTTLLMIATDAFQKYQKATGASMDQTTGLLKLSEEQFENLQSLFFNIGAPHPHTHASLCRLTGFVSLFQAESHTS